MQDYEDVIRKECVMSEETKTKAAQIYAEAFPLFPIAKVVAAVSDLVDAAVAVLPAGEIDNSWSKELIKLDEAVAQVKETFKEGAKSTVPKAMECKYSIGVLCEHKDFPHKPALCDLGYCPLIAEKL
jgi:hypothetical protein